jgi:dynein heavy chain, axonemal
LSVLWSRINISPESLDELGEGLVLWERLNSEQSQIESRIPPLFDQFAILDKYEVFVPDELQNQLRDLPSQWHEFQTTLVKADEMLKKSKVLFRCRFQVNSCLNND